VLTKTNDKTEPSTTATKPEELRLPKPTDLIFPKWQRELFKTILEEENLRVDRDGRARTAYSLRHTYICLRLMEGADIYQIAKNCRTSVEMIEKYYAAHIKTNLDAAAINIMRPKPKKTQEDAKIRVVKGGRPTITKCLKVLFCCGGPQADS
jgi:integrase